MNKKLASAIIGAFVFSGFAITPGIASAAEITHSSSYNVGNFAELTVANVNPDGTNGDFSWGGTYSTTYSVELVDPSTGDVKYMWNNIPAGTYPATQHDYTVAAGNYTFEIIPTGASTMSANGTVFWDNNY